MRTPARIRRRSFIDRYVFPDGELHELGAALSRMLASGFEVRHVEGLRGHYALTLRAWVQNRERSWDACVAQAGEARARIWRLYMGPRRSTSRRDVRRSTKCWR
jgi:cyclopropane-fatty-acyl-phospholipid synthase